MVARCLEAARPFAGRISVLDLRTIIPWDQEAVLENVRQTGKVLIVHEDTLTNGFAGEICAVVVSQAFTDLDAPVEPIGVPDIPIPYNIRMMNAIVPSVASIRATMERLLAFYTLPAWNDFFHARSTEIFAFDCSLQQNQKAIKAC